MIWLLGLNEFDCTLQIHDLNLSHNLVPYITVSKPINEAVKQLFVSILYHSTWIARTFLY